MRISWLEERERERDLWMGEIYLVKVNGVSNYKVLADLIKMFSYFLLNHLIQIKLKAEFGMISNYICYLILWGGGGG